MLRSVQSSKVVALVDGPVQRCATRKNVRSMVFQSFSYIALFTFVIKVTSEGIIPSKVRRYQGILDFRQL